MVTILQNAISSLEYQHRTKVRTMNASFLSSEHSSIHWNPTTSRASAASATRADLMSATSAAASEFDAGVYPEGRVSKPKKAMTAYNMFYAYERKRILAGVDMDDSPISIKELLRIRRDHKISGKRSHKKSHGMIGFQELNRRISQSWKALSDDKRMIFQDQAVKEKEVYTHQLAVWQRCQLEVRGMNSVGDSNIPLGRIPARVSTDSLSGSSQESTESFRVKQTSPTMNAMFPSIPNEWLQSLTTLAPAFYLYEPLSANEMDRLFE